MPQSIDLLRQMFDAHLIRQNGTCLLGCQEAMIWHRWTIFQFKIEYLKVNIRVALAW